MLFGQAVQLGYYVLQNARDEYRLACGPSGMHQQLVQDYLQVTLCSQRRWQGLLWCARGPPSFSAEAWLGLCLTSSRTVSCAHHMVGITTMQGWLHQEHGRSCCLLATVPQ